MTIAEKLQKIIDIKSDIKEAINEKGVSVTDTDSFASYADKIKSIETGDGSENSGDDTSQLIQLIEGTITDLVIPNGTTEIASYAFYYSCPNLSSVTIPDSVTSTGGYVFYGCHYLKKVWFPSTITTTSAAGGTLSPFYQSNACCTIYTDIESADDVPVGCGANWNCFDNSGEVPLEVVYGATYEEFLNDKNLFPDFSDYTEGDYTISASSEYASGYRAWQAFDGDTSTCWRSKNAPTEDEPQWIEIACGQSTTLSKLKLYFSSTSYMATDFVVQGSTDGEDWRDLATVTGNTYTLVNLNVDDSEAWKYFRIYFTGCNGSSLRLYGVQARGNA